MRACSEVYMRGQHHSLVVDLILVYRLGDTTSTNNATSFWARNQRTTQELCKAEMLKGCTIRKDCGGRVVPTGLVWHSMHDAKLLENVSFFEREF